MIFRSLSAAAVSSASNFSASNSSASMSARVARLLGMGLVSLAAVSCSSGEGTVDRNEGIMEMNRVVSANEAGGTENAAAVMDAESELPGAGPNLLVTNSWVPNSSNGVGIQGAFFTYGDGSGRTEIAEDPQASTTGFCVAGESGQVIGGDFGGTWGAVAALNLRQAVGVDTAGAYDAQTNGVVGFGFDIVGSTGGQLRFVSKQFNVHDGFCQTTQIADCGEGCSVEVMIEDMTQNCWEAGGVAPRVSEMSAIEWQITTSEAGPTPFSYCIENLHALMGD